MTGKTGCSEMEVRNPICPAMIRYAPPMGEGNAHQCPWCGEKVYPEYKVEKCELCGYPITTNPELIKNGEER